LLADSNAARVAPGVASTIARAIVVAFSLRVPTSSVAIIGTGVRRPKVEVGR
jgi:hypothetical protein